MSEQIQISKRVFSKDDYKKVINTSFNQLLTPITTTEPTFSIDDFFQTYSDLFYQIPKEGDVNSHSFILNKTTDYLGVKLADDIDIQALLDEITELRQQLLDANTLVNNLTKNT